MEKENDLLDNQLEGDEDLLDFDLDDLTEIEFSEESGDEEDIIELIDLVEEGEIAVESTEPEEDEISTLLEHETVEGDAVKTLVLDDPVTRPEVDLMDSDSSTENDLEIDMSFSDLELSDEPDLTEDLADSQKDEDFVDLETFEEEEVGPDLGALLSDQDLIEELDEKELGEIIEVDLIAEEPASAGETAGGGNELEDIISIDGLSEEPPGEDLESVIEIDLEAEGASPEEIPSLISDEPETLPGEKEKTADIDIQPTQEWQPASEDDRITPEEMPAETEAPVGEILPEVVALSEEKIEAIVKNVVEEVMERVTRETMSTIVENVARETMAATAERVISEAIEALKQSLDSSSD